MAFCGACGAASEGRFCGICGMPTEMSAGGVGPVPPAPPAFATPPVPGAPDVLPVFEAPPLSPAFESPPVFESPPLAPLTPAFTPASAPAFESPPLSPAFPPPPFRGPPPTQRELPILPFDAGSSSAAFPQVAPLTPTAMPQAIPQAIPQEARPKSIAPPPPLASRPAASGRGEIVRPSEATAMVHRHGASIPAGTSVEIGPDDTFYGVVTTGGATAGTNVGARQVAFALMTGVRKTPESCEGYFVSRGVEGVELTHGGLELRDLKGAIGEVSVEGRLSFEIVDPVKLLASDVPLDDDGLSSLVTGTMADAVDRALREGLARGEYTMHELVSGDADVRVLDRCTSERIAPKLVRSHGVSTEVAELRIRGTLSSDVDSALQAIPRPAHSHEPHDSRESLESTMNEPTFLERPEGSIALFYRSPGALPAGTVINIRLDDNFLGFVRGEPPQQLPPGRHRVARALDAGLFVAMTGETTTFGASLGSMRDFHGNSADVRVFGQVEIHVDDPLELAIGMTSAGGDHFAVVPDEVMMQARAATIEVIRAVVRNGLSSGESDLASLPDAAEVEELGRRTAKAYDTFATRVSGTTIQLLEVTVTVSEITRADVAQSTIREPVQAAAPPQTRDPEPEPVQPEGGTMHVRPDELEEAYAFENEPANAMGATDAMDAMDDDAERTMLPIPSMQYPPREARPPQELHTAPAAHVSMPSQAYPPVAARNSEPPDSVMPTAVSPPNYIQDVMSALTPQNGIPHAVAEAHARAQALPDAITDGEETVNGEARMTLPSAHPPAVTSAARSSGSIDPIRAMPAPRAVGGQLDPWSDFAPSHASAAHAPSPEPAPEPHTNGGPPPPPAPIGFSVGAQVLVMWSDGQRYPGQVHQMTPDHCLVVFSNGHQQWVPMDALSGA